MTAIEVRNVKIKRFRIVEGSYAQGTRFFRIQQKGGLFFWFRWVDAWMLDSLGAMCQDTFLSLKDAREALCYFGASGPVEELVSPECEE